MLVALLSCIESPKQCHQRICHPRKPIKRGITWYFKLNGSQPMQIFICECQNPRWRPKSKMAAEILGFSRQEFLVWPISTTMQKIRLVPKCVTHADLSCRTIRSQGISRHGIDCQSQNILSPTSEEFIYPMPSHHLNQLEQLQRLCSKIPPTAPWLPILVIHIRSQVKTRQSQSYKF